MYRCCGSTIVYTLCGEWIGSFGRRKTKSGNGCPSNRKKAEREGQTFKHFECWSNMARPIKIRIHSCPYVHNWGSPFNINWRLATRFLDCLRPYPWEKPDGQVSFTFSWPLYRMARWCLSMLPRRLLFFFHESDDMGIFSLSKIKTKVIRLAVVSCNNDQRASSI